MLREARTVHSRGARHRCENSVVLPFPQMVYEASLAERLPEGSQCRLQGFCPIPSHRRDLSLPLVSILDSARTGPVLQSCLQKSVTGCV